MRIKPKPIPEPKIHPVRLDLSDLQAVLNEFPDAKLVLEIEDYGFDSIDDIEKNLHAPAAIERLDLVLPSTDEASGTRLQLVPCIAATGGLDERRRALETQARDVLRTFHRRPLPEWLGSFAWGATFVGTTANIVAGQTGVKSEQGWRIGLYVIATVLVIGSVALLGIMWTRRGEDMIIPRRKQASWFRRRGPSWVGTVVLAAITTTVGLILGRLLK